MTSPLGSIALIIHCLLGLCHLHDFGTCIETTLGVSVLYCNSGIRIHSVFLRGRVHVKDASN